ncbi:MAG: hypothetical protein ABW110_21610 [Steroidobacteraceae bacterium]
MQRRRFLKSSVGVSLLATNWRLFTETAAARSRFGDIPARTLDGGEVVLAEADVRNLIASVRPPIGLLGMVPYDAGRRLWNARFDHHPCMIVECTDTADVTAAVQFARPHGC